MTCYRTLSITRVILHRIIIANTIANIMTHHTAVNIAHIITHIPVPNHILKKNIVRTIPPSKPSGARNTALTTDRNTTYIDVSHSLTFIFNSMYSCSQFNAHLGHCSCGVQKFPLNLHRWGNACRGEGLELIAPCATAHVNLMPPNKSDYLDK